MDKVEQVARMIAMRLYGGYPLDDDARASWPQWQICTEVAIAAITAMREPTEAMKDQMCEIGPDTNHGEFDWDDAAKVWSAGIDAALSEAGETNDGH